jgi:hypothetical protein
MNTWVKMINEDRYVTNPDEYKTDDNFVQADEFEDLQKELDDYFKKAEKTGKIEGNLKESDEEGNLSSDVKPTEDEPEENPEENVSKSEDEGEATENEAMTPDQIAAEWAKKVEKVVINELYDGYVSCTVFFKDGKSEDKEYEIPDESVFKMLAILKKKMKKATEEDAVVAIIRKKFDPNDEMGWYYQRIDLNAEWDGDAALDGITDQEVNDIIGDDDALGGEDYKKRKGGRDNWDYGAPSDDDPYASQEDDDNDNPFLDTVRNW